MRYSGFDHAPFRAPAAFAVILLIALSIEAHAQDAPMDARVARRMTAFYEMYTGRKLTAAEARGVTSEFIGGHSRRGKSSQAIRNLSEQFGMYTILLREEGNNAAAITLRHSLLDANYFVPAMQNTVELRLLTEPDPVCVVDTRSKRLMTQRDVVALANIRHFATSDEAPRHRDLSRRELDELVSLLKRSVGGNGGTMPQFFADAGAYWAGVRQQWPYFTAQQRSMARAYALSSWRVSMPVEMYASLWGYDYAGAQTRWTADVTARIRGRADPLPGLADLHAAIDSMFE